MERRNRRVWIAIGLWLIAIAGAAALDRTAASTAHGWGTDSYLKSHRILRDLLKAPGIYVFTMVLAIPVGFWHAKRWRASVFLLVATATSALNEVIKWISGRARPFKILSGDEIGLLKPFDLHPFPPFSSSNLCFPSGHATLAFATAAAMGILWPKGRWAFYALAAIVAAERVLENAHWFSDAVAAAALGVGGVYAVRILLWERKWGNRPHG